MPEEAAEKLNNPRPAAGMDGARRRKQKKTIYLRPALRKRGLSAAHRAQKSPEHLRGAKKAKAQRRSARQCARR
ncbi:MAG: hypothetical protein BHW65_07245 [Verrucomicrobia bacterium CAG:312_58_20]|nr:MAG: hypothetical protein BHW65_07245 [Verrucomicrobia bacterium CAG:312_58_20]